MTSTARQLRQPPTIEAIERVPYFADGVFYRVLLLIADARLLVQPAAKLRHL